MSNTAAMSATGEDGGNPRPALLLAMTLPASLLGLADTFRMLRLPDVTAEADLDAVGFG